MKFIISSSELLKGILTVSKAIPAKSTEAILEDYLFSLNGNILEVTASDKEITMKTTLEVDSTEAEGKIAVPARQLNDLLKELPDQPLTISTISENQFECAWASGASTLPYFNPDDYPESQKTGESAVTVEFPAQTLADGIGRTIYASSDEDNRPVMNSIFFDISPDSTTLVASDLQKLTCYTADNVKAGEPCSFILNKRHAAVLKSILGKDIENVSVTFDSRTAVFRFDNTTVICCLVVGKYPDYRTIIPQNNSNILKINRLQLLNTVKRIAVCSPKASNHIKFDMSSGSIEISAQDLGFEIAAHEKLACQYDGSDLSIGFKSTHIIEMLSNLTCEEVVMKFADKRRSALMLPSEEDAQAEKVFGIVMPIMVK
ncbi:MAG: DNA polymerase III subunit beta [Bacteroidales bacterium]|nr:DNA polymerase III subunit beta [Bacteroidales bacterium]